MPSLADSDAILDLDRMLIQHQAALTLLQGTLSDPMRTEVRWLDLASGKGQIIAHLHNNLTARARGKLHFVGYDIDNDHSRIAEKTANSMELGSCAFGIGDLSSFHRNELTDGLWDFITLTNTIHEIRPRALSVLLVECLVRLNNTGCLFVYDMSRLPSPELGAVLWTGADFQRIFSAICTTLGASTYEPAVGIWDHSKCVGWNAQIRRDHMQLPPQWISRKEQAIETASACIQELLQSKLTAVRQALEALTRYGSQTRDESIQKNDYLFDFWAISRALEPQL